MRPRPRAAYDYDAILGQLASVDYANARWREFFAANDIDPYYVEYERLASDYIGTTTSLLAHLGRPVAPTAPRLLRQATAQSEEFVRRFLTDYARAV